jgi:hypothetical protein
LLGLAHGGQPEGTPYRAIVEKDAEAFHDATKSVAKAYLDLAREIFRDK